MTNLFQSVACWPQGVLAGPIPFGITVAEILSVKDNLIKVTGLDALNGTPILDIKPYEEHFDSHVGIEKERDPSFKPIDNFSYRMHRSLLRGCAAVVSPGTTRMEHVNLSLS